MLSFFFWFYWHFLPWSHGCNKGDYMMKNASICFILSIGLIFLTSCAARFNQAQCVHNVSHCKNECQERLNACNQACQNSCRNCSLEASINAKRNYSRYNHEQYVQGGIMVRDLKSYQDPLQCRKTTCNCWADYNVCKQSCKGLIHKRLQVSPACC